ncbi:MAG TPA: hypothetical protein VNF68_11440 [Candidatus Baltobacteraceae bacterium]|nr:hypothetical protein [Candidatus Baltobacteraceae bacterium]
MKPYALVFGAAFALMCLAVTGWAQASCPQRTTVELITYGVSNAATSFDGIRGAATSGGQYNLTPSAEAYCPNHFILERAEAANGQPAYWVLKFAASRRGDEKAVSAWIVKDLWPSLKAGHYRFVSLKDSELGGLRYYWVGPANCWLVIETYADDNNSAFTDLAIHVGRDLP